VECVCATVECTGVMFQFDGDFFFGFPYHLTNFEIKIQPFFKMIKFNLLCI
jgi:hypothetical protein